MKELTQKAKELTNKANAFKKDVKARMGLAIAAAFALVIGLSWNEFIKEGVTRLITYLGVTGQELWLKLLVAVLTTILCVIGIKYFSKWGEQ